MTNAVIENPFIEHIEIEQARADYAREKRRGDALRKRKMRDLANSNWFERLLGRLIGIDMVAELNYVPYPEAAAERRLRELERRYGLPRFPAT